MKEFCIDIYLSALKEKKQQEVIEILKDFNLDVEQFKNEPLATLVLEYVGEKYEEDSVEITEEDEPEVSGLDIFGTGNHRGWRNWLRLRD